MITYISPVSYLRASLRDQKKLQRDRHRLKSLMPLFRAGHSWFLKNRLMLLVSMSVIAPIGYAIRFAQGPIPEWLKDAIGGLAYEIFWVLLVVFLFPRAVLRLVAIGVCLSTCGLECLQLWHPPLLEAARATLAGRLVLGNTFSWLDFPPYFLGSWLGWLWVRSAQKLGLYVRGDRH